MDSSTFQTDLATALGNSMIDVELTPTDYTHAYNMAKRTFVQKGNNNLNRNFITLPVTVGVRSYVLVNEPAIDPIVDTVVRVIKPSYFTLNDPFTLSIFNNIFNSTLVNANGTGLLTYELTAQLLENIDIYTAKNTPFIYQKRNYTINFLDKPEINETWMLEVYTDLSDNEYRDNLWIFEWSLAECKIMLGRAYSKFQSLSGPTGEVSLNGDSLIQEGQADKERLLEEIKNYTDGGPIGGAFLIG